MSDSPVELATPPEWRFDLAQVSRRAWIDFSTGKLSADEDDALLARVSGMSADMIQALPVLEYKALVRAFVRKLREPLANPNSAAPSTTP